MLKDITNIFIWRRNSIPLETMMNRYKTTNSSSITVGLSTTEAGWRNYLQPHYLMRVSLNMYIRFSSALFGHSTPTQLCRNCFGLWFPETLFETTMPFKLTWFFLGYVPLPLNLEGILFGLWCLVNLPGIVGAYDAYFTYLALLGARCHSAYWLLKGFLVPNQLTRNS